MRYAIGKFLQMWGLATTGYALYVGTTVEDAMDQEFFFLGAGIVIFVLGYFVEGRSD